MLEAKHISFSYGKETPILRDVSFELKPAERLHISAPSGSGKTTLARILAGYLMPAEGEVLVDGVTLPSKGACPVQLIGQHPELALDPRMRMIDSLREAGKIQESLNRKLGIQETWFRRYPHELSGGELQRFCIARALMAKPKYLIADEISTMLDSLTQALIWNVLLEELRLKQIGLIFTTHSKSLADRLATRSFEL